MSDQTLPAPIGTTNGPLTSFTIALVRHLADEITVFRTLQHRLDHEDLTDAELRRELGQMFQAGLDGYAIARGFHDSIVRLESSDDQATAALTGDAAVVAAMGGWIQDLQGAADTVVTDLVAIEALIGVVERRHELDSSTSAAFESIRALTYSAIGRLDEARSPDRDRAVATQAGILA